MGSCLSTDWGNSIPNSPTSASLDNQNQGKNLNKNNKWEDQLHRIPGRVCLNGSTDIASLFTQQGKKGTNQDAMIVWENFGSRTDTIFCGVFDGHGPFGHIVAKKVRDSLPVRFNTQLEASISRKDMLKDSDSAKESMNSDDTSSLCTEEEPSDFFNIEDKEKLQHISTIKESFLKAFKVMDKELRLHPSVNCICSGTTAVTLIKQGQDLVIGNIGDSRAILGTRDEDGSLIAVQLTIDLKPDLPREAERIRRCKGRVFSVQGEPDVARVWMPTINAPGLAMARAFGDFCLKRYGVISVPDVSYRHLTDKDEFIVMATDGVWDVLSNKEVVEIVNSAPTRSSAARTLVESAVKSWKTKFPTSKIDDCAVVCLYLNPLTSTISSFSLSKSKIQPEPSEQVDNEEDSSAVLSGLDRSGTIVIATCPDDGQRELVRQEEEKE